MKYIVIEIQNNADGTTGNLINTYADREDAEAKYHTVLSAAAKSAVMIHACAMLTSTGEHVKSEFFTHPVPAPEPGEGIPEEE